MRGLGSNANGAGATVSIAVTATPAAGGTVISTTAGVTAAEDDSNATDNSVNVTTCVDKVADLTISLAASPAPVPENTPLIYILTVTNDGPSQAGSMVATAAIQAGATFVSAVPYLGSCSFASGTVTCNLGALDSGAVGTVTIIVTPVQIDGSNVVVTVSVTAVKSDPNAANNSAALATSVSLSEPVPGPTPTPAPTPTPEPTPTPTSGPTPTPTTVPAPGATSTPTPTATATPTPGEEPTTTVPLVAAAGLIGLAVIAIGAAATFLGLRRRPRVL